MAGQVLMTISRDKNESDRLLSEYKGQVDMQSKMVNAKRERDKEIARKMKVRARPLNEISEDTGLDIAAIMSL